MEAEMKAVFDQKVHEKETKLKQSEDDVNIFIVFNVINIIQKRKKKIKKV